VFFTCLYMSAAASELDDESSVEICASRLKCLRT